MSQYQYYIVSTHLTRSGHHRQQKQLYAEHAALGK